MLDAALAEQLELGILAMVRLLPEPLDPAELEGREVIALEEADEVRRADDDAAVRVSLHAARIPLLGRWRAGSVGDSARPGGERVRLPDPAPIARTARPTQRERHGEDEHQGGSHDAEEDGRAARTAARGSR